MLYRFIMLSAVLGLCGTLSSAQNPPAADRISADTPDGALVCAATRFRGEPLSIEQDDGMVELRWLTPSQNVLRITLTGPGCRFIDVRGVGLSEAWILP
ncbi:MULTISPECIES: Cys/Met metabolism pyridoxal-phosphate-dependent enzyme [unclassified Yoonia]|uniref:Cys/Met metabolism pyridoxal-phosphate-dependent enzyme n=1 Tax=unclassified Yoonia TaxID=2629118 RepID=UPI002AFE6D8D|nr:MULTISPECIES: Cys/Met metabolism pyridoxal-phosphate-dependent enzyme [unclassified Yoonia]